MKSLDQHNQDTWKKFQDYFMMHHSKCNGIACPSCGTELYDTNPSVQLASWPPQYHVHCKECAYTGYRY